ncbi:hypothetical protein A6R68_09005, partial [Neotoma lepida]
SSLNFEKHSENFSWTENRYDVSRRRHNSSDGFDSGIGRPNGGNFGRKEKNGWRTHGRNGTENINHRGGYHGGNSRSRSSIFHSGKSQGLHENSIPDNDTGRKEDKRERRQFEAEDFPSLNPEYEREPNQNKSLAAGLHAQTHTYPTKKISQAPLLEYPPNPKSRAPRMLVIKKGNTKDLQLSGFPVAGNLHLHNGKAKLKKTKLGLLFLMNLHMVLATLILLSQQPRCNRSNSSSPVDKLNQQPRLTKLTRMRSDKKSEFLKALKRDRVEEEHEDESHAGSEKDDDSFNLHNSNSTHQERDINRNFDENEIPQENGNASVISQQIIRSSTFPQTDVLSSSLEAEHRLLKEMGWQEDSENDETCAPLTEDEMREFQVISEQLQKNGLRKNGILKNGLICDFKFGPWKNSTFKPTIENDDTETSSSDTSDDDDVTTVAVWCIVELYSVETIGQEVLSPYSFLPFDSNDRAFLPNGHVCVYFLTCGERILMVTELHSYGSYFATILDRLREAELSVGSLRRSAWKWSWPGQREVGGPRFLTFPLMKPTSHVLYSDLGSHSATDSSGFLQWNFALLFQAVCGGRERSSLFRIRVLWGDREEEKQDCRVEGKGTDMKAGGDGILAHSVLGFPLNTAGSQCDMVRSLVFPLSPPPALHFKEPGFVEVSGVLGILVRNAKLKGSPPPRSQEILHVDHVETEDQPSPRDLLV